MPSMLRSHQEHGFLVRPWRVPILRRSNRGLPHLPQDRREAHFTVLEIFLKLSEILKFSLRNIFHVLRVLLKVVETTYLQLRLIEF